jgi:geranylgeranyl pyrophosphate synthase
MITETARALIEAKSKFLQGINSGPLREQLAYAIHGAPENKQWGSQSRGLIILFFSNLEESAMNGALSIELMHNAALIIDDLIDQTTTRRDNAAFWVRYGRETTTLVAHILISKAIEELGKVPDRYQRLIQPIISDISVMAEAELSAGRQEVQTGREYLLYAHAKTARPFERAAALGLAPNRQLASLIYGVGRIGLLHQIVDDSKDQTTDKVSESTFGQCNWTRLSKVEQKVILNEISVIQNVEWPRLQDAICKFSNAGALVEILRDVGQLPNLKVRSLAI